MTWPLWTLARHPSVRVTYGEACRMTLDEITTGLILCFETDRVRRPKPGAARG